MIISLAFALLTALSPAAERFTGMLADGNRITGKDVSAWNNTGSKPQLGNEKLFNPDNHVRWLRDNGLPPGEPPEAFVEFYGGDRMPGRAMAFRGGGEMPFDRQPPHLVVEQPEIYNWPTAKRETVRVTTAWLRRIVWAHRPGDRYHPGTVFARDGRQLRFRSLRFVPDGVRLLLDEGTENLRFGEMAELHMKPRDPWAAYYDQLAWLSPGGESRLLRVETSDGLIATGSMERFQARSLGGSAERWFHAVQPAWSLDPVWARHRTIHLRQFSLPHQVPLSHVELTSAATGGDGSHWTWRRDRNVRGGMLKSGEEDFGWGWGLGVHAPSRLSVALPAAARSFRTKIGLDEIAGRGGCAQALVYADRNLSKPLFRSDLLIGSQQVLSPGAWNLPGDSDRTLTLVADTAHRDRPKGADPLNIRDMVDWLEPELELDANLVKREIRRRAQATIAAWQDWTIKPDDPDAIDLSNHWDNTEPASPRYRMEIVARRPNVTLSRTIKLSGNDRWLCLAVSRFEEDTDDSKIEVRIAGKRLGRLDVPKRQTGGGDPDPLLFSLADYAGKDVTLDIVLPTGEKAKLDWRGVAVTQFRPGLRRLFEEEEDFARRLGGEGEATIETNDRHTGTRSLKITPTEKQSARLPGLPVAIRSKPRLGEFRYIRFAWKKRGGRRICLQIGHDGRFGPTELDDKTPSHSFRYDAGSGDASYGSALRLANRIPGDWVVVTRDLYSDFGAFTLTGLSFAAVDGDHALFDHIYAGRTLNDFQQIEVPARR